MEMRVRVGAPLRSRLAQPRRQAIKLAGAVKVRYGLQLAIRRSDGTTQVGLLGIEETIDPAAHLSANPAGFEVEQRAIRAGESQQGRDLLLALKVDHVAAAPLHQAPYDVVLGEQAVQPARSLAVAQNEFDMRPARAERDRRRSEQRTANEGAAIARRLERRRIVRRQPGEGHLP